jgi:hypothetical protein
MSASEGLAVPCPLTGLGLALTCGERYPAVPSASVTVTDAD